MKKPHPVITLRDGPNVALRIMKEFGISSVFVVDKEKKHQGIITVDMALEARDAKVTSLSEMQLALGPVVEESTPIKDMLGVIAESKLPLAVVNAENKLMGIIVRGAVLAALDSENRGDNND